MERKGRVEGKVALITGVAKPDSIGFATAKVFAQEGAMLAIVDIADAVHDCAELLRGEGFTVSSHTADLTKMDQVKKAVDEALTCYGHIDVLVNNAGMVLFGQEEDFTAFQDLTEESWDFGIAINLKTQFNVTRTVVPHMIAQKYGRIVNVSSVTGPVVANPDESAYCAAKAGVLGMTRGLALDVAKHGVTVNAVGPGLDPDGVDGRGRGRGRHEHPAGPVGVPGGGRQGHLLPRLRRRELHHRAAHRHRRRQHDPGVQGPERAVLLRGEVAWRASTSCSSSAPTGATPRGTGRVIDTPEGDVITVGVDSVDQACAVAAAALADGTAHFIELCGDFGEEGCRRVIAAVDGKLPVGYVTYFPEEAEKLDRLFGAAG